MQKLPIGVQAFSILRNEGYAYIDKTAHILRLVTEGRVYFLSRPRRFGKSLLISTLEALFRGDEALFRGLAIHDKWDWAQKHPIVRLDWSTLAHGTAAEMSISTSRCFADIAAEHGIVLSSTIPSEIFNELLKKLYAKTGAQPVVLIDEYDKPILDALEREDGELESIRDFLRNLYGVLKGNDERLRFVFLTGVSRFAGVSVFSGLNNLSDITLGEDYSTLCGYTQEELESVFSEEIKSLAANYEMTIPDFLDSIRQWYNGYSW
ncbi:MAG: AAA family ATPase, partial [Puniceicoccales bacterium]|nr:AAA family ATPase [Puniceicoccales bacterium]